MSSAPPFAAPLVETTEDRLRWELSQSSQAEARESLLREECARLRADIRRAAHALPRGAGTLLREILLANYLFAIPVCNDTGGSW